MRLALALMLLVGCTTNNPPKEAAPEHPDAAVPIGACTSDTDCRTWSSYCMEAPCACRVLARNDPAPVCASAARVACFVDPCAGKGASCQAGRCALVPQSRPSSSM